MKRCQHDWQPLIPRPIVVAEGEKLAVAFSLQLSRLDGYDRCALCGRLSWITKTRWRNRKLISCPEIAGRIQQRADDFLKWVETRCSKPGPAMAH